MALQSVAQKSSNGLPILEGDADPTRAQHAGVWRCNGAGVPWGRDVIPRLLFRGMPDFTSLTYTQLSPAQLSSPDITYLV